MVPRSSDRVLSTSRARESAAAGGGAATGSMRKDRCPERPAGSSLAMSERDLVALALSMFSRLLALLRPLARATGTVPCRGVRVRQLSVPFATHKARTVHAEAKIGCLGCTDSLTRAGCTSSSGATWRTRRRGGGSADCRGRSRRAEPLPRGVLGADARPGLVSKTLLAVGRRRTRIVDEWQSESRPSAWLGWTAVRRHQRAARHFSLLLPPRSTTPGTRPVRDDLWRPRRTNDRSVQQDPNTRTCGCFDRPESLRVKVITRTYRRRGTDGRFAVGRF